MLCGGESCWLRYQTYPGKSAPNAAAAIPALIDWPLGGERETEDEVCYALSNCAAGFAGR